MTEHNGSNALEGGIGGFLLGSLLSGNGGGLFGGGGNNGASTAFIQSEFNNLGSQVQGIGSAIQNTAANTINQFQHGAILGAINDNAKDAVAQGYQNTITGLQSNYALQKSICDLGTQMQLGFKDAQLQTAMQTNDIKDTVNAGFTRQLESDLAQSRHENYLHRFITPLQQQIANINVTVPKTP